MYRGVPGEEDRGNVLARRALRLSKALDHMAAALQILDGSDVSPAIGARLDGVIEDLRREIGEQPGR